MVACGSSPYGGPGLAAQPDSLDDYFQILIGSRESSPIDEKRLELFAYFYFMKHNIPWGLTKQVYADEFRGFAFSSLDELLPGRDKHLDHLCACVLDPDNTVPEAW